MRLTAATLSGVAWLKAAQAAWLEYRSAVPRRGPVPPLEGDRFAAFERITFRSRDGATMCGIRAKGANGAAIVLVHGSSADRRSLLVEAGALSRAGYSVLAYDHPGHGESEGRARWTSDMPAALHGAVDWISEQPGVAKGLIGVVGFSLGCATTVEVAARDSRVGAVALLGAFTDARAQTLAEYAAWGPIQQIPALLVMRAFGIGPLDLRPIDHVASLAPRPLLFVAGTEDHVVPAFMSRALFDAAGEPKELWTVEGAGHGGYERAAPEEYPRRLVEFFDAAFFTNDR
jgi:pimeloyl-ACP methyl ester carboxylesterase